jgi:hypothetical protein
MYAEALVRLKGSQPQLGQSAVVAQYQDQIEQQSENFRSLDP